MQISSASPVETPALATPAPIETAVDTPHLGATVAASSENDDTTPPAATRTARRRTKRSPAWSSPLGLIVTVTVLAAGAAGLVVLFDSSARHARGHDRFNVSVRDIEITPLPVWIRTDMLAHVQRHAGLPDTLNTLEPDLAGELRDAFSLSPWVREVVEVRITHPRTIRVKLEYREPVAVVQSARSLDAVDRDGVVLPVAELPEPDLYLTVTGLRSTPTGPVGTKWDDPALAAAVAVANVVSPHHRALGLTTIDASGYRSTGAASSVVYLLTDRGTRVKWGRPPDLNYPGEVPVPDKLDRLTKYVTEHGSLDAPAGPYEIDVTHWQEFTVRPRGQTPAKKR